MRKRFDTSALFYSYPAWLIAEWCCVSEQTAYHWKSGIRRPGKTALRLFLLHKEGRVLTDEWQGWGVREGRLCDPSGNELSQGQVRAYPFVYQLAQEFGKQNSRAHEVLQRLSAVATIKRATVSKKDRDAFSGPNVLSVPVEVAAWRRGAARRAARALRKKSA